MCGISGAVTKDDDGVTDRFLKDCLSDHAKRGPDRESVAKATVGGWRVTFGHRRLAILDLTAGGDQPMGRGGQTVVTYNGEIYNYVELRRELEALGQRFESDSDTEVLLAAYQVWGEGCFQRLNGMFAIGLLDAARRCLLLVRDRFGVKPLHYHRGPERLLFSSTAGPISREIGVAPDMAFLAAGLARHRFEDGSERTQYVGVAAVRPGHLYRIPLTARSLEVERFGYYDLASRTAGGDPQCPAPAAECLRRVTDAVSLRLRADVPVGVSLSGGLDSMAIAALMRRRGPVTGVCFGHPDQARSEGPAVRRLAADIDLDVTYVWPGPESMVEAFEQCLAAQDAPFTTGSVVAQFAVYRAARAAGIKVMLTGQGADEAFLGYRKSMVSDLRDAWHRRAIGDTVRRFAWLGRVGLAEFPALADYRGAIGLRLGRPSAMRGFPVRPQIEDPFGGDTRRRQIDDIVRGGLPTLLRYEDRNSMASSLESRFPYLDYRLVEWAIGLPTEWKVNAGWGKYVLRQAMTGLIPERLVQERRKRGFDVGLRTWIGLGLGATIRAGLARNRIRLAKSIGWRVAPDEYPDRVLAGDRSAFLAATTALWLGRVLE